MRNANDHILICPANDPESILILKIAKALSIPFLRSAQRHGGTLDQEIDLIARLYDINRAAKTVVIVELPSISMEQSLEEAGFDLVIIDHHRYEYINRMKDQSSIEQFVSYFQISDEELNSVDISPILVRGVGAIDRGFLWELSEEGFTESEKNDIVLAYKEMQRGLDPDRRKREERLALELWRNREERDGRLIFVSDESRVSVRDAISYFVFDAYPVDPPETILVQGNRRIYVQETARAQKLFDRFGGFTFGKERCWGYVSETGNTPTLDEVLDVIVK